MRTLPNARRRILWPLMSRFSAGEEFRIEREIGRGATAQVFLATRTADGRAVALKVFHPGFFEVAELRRRAESEFRTVSSLEHPNIVRVLESRLSADPPSVAFEFVDGVSLEEFQKRLPYVLPEISVRVVIRVLDALEHAHARGVVHRDLKPANILVSREGAVLVTDFGLSKVTDASRLTLSGAILGSPDFMSPEQARGDLVNPASDVFSAAAVLYSLVTGTRPFARANPLTTLAAVVECRPEPAVRRNPKISAPLSAILERALSADPTRRFASARELADALRAYLEGVGLTETELDLPFWIQAPGEITIRALGTMSAHLTSRAESELRAGRPARAIELVAQISTIAPESAAVGRLMTELRHTRRRGWIPRAALAAALLALAGASLPWLLARRAPSASARYANVAPAQAPAPAAPAKPRLASVRFELPPGARVLWDGASIDARRPLRSQTPGLHSLRLEKNGMQPIDREVRIDLDKPNVIRAWAPTETVHFEVGHEIAVYWDGERIDAAVPLKNQRPGPHELRLERPGFHPVTSEVTVNENEPTVIRAQ